MTNCIFKIFITVYLVISSLTFCVGQQNLNIATVRMYVAGNEQAYPYIQLNTNEQVMLEFDELSNNALNFSYKITHCNSNWEPSLLQFDEYIDGFEVNRVDDYSFSRNTLVPYVNYRVALPNNDVKFLVSGNYKIEVFCDDYTDKGAVIESRFSVYEPLWQIRAKITRPLNGNYAQTGHELRFTVNYQNTVINDPFAEVKVVALQNNRSDAVIDNFKPAFVRQNELVYGVAGDYVFKAFNEFRLFDTRDTRFAGNNINDIKFFNNQYHFKLNTDDSRGHKSYFTDKDMNGAFVIYANNQYDYNVTADYVNVYFSLKPLGVPDNGQAFVTGSFSNYSYSNNYTMEFNNKTGLYEKVLLLKQGYYNYMYCFKSFFTQSYDCSEFEGCYYETENNYVILVYHKAFGARYERLTGFTVVNSRGY